MPDQNPRFEKVPRPESIDTLIRYLRSSKVVIDVEKVDEQIIRVERSNGPAITVFLTNIYIVGEADAVEILSEHRGIDCIVTMSVWNGYTSNGKDHCRREGVGLFTFKEFLGAVYKKGKKFLDYGNSESLKQ
jgi:hypothetical protein